MAIYGHRADGSELKTQWETILYYLQTNPGTTIRAWQAIKEFGFTRLSGIVKLIEYRTGIVLKRQDVKVTTRYGGTTWITEYWYDENGQD
jgi:hypothetical protein